MILLTANEAEHNLKVFKLAVDKKAAVTNPNPQSGGASVYISGGDTDKSAYYGEVRSLEVKAARQIPTVDTNADCVGNGGNTYNLPFAPNDPYEYFSDCSNHANVLSTFLSTCMGLASYVPNQSRIDGDAKKEAKAFSDFISKIGDSVFRQYMFIKESTSIDISSSSCAVLLDGIRNLVEEGVAASGSLNPAIAIANSIGSLIQNVGKSLSSATSENYRSLFGIYHFEGSDWNPTSTIYWCTTSMRKESSGKHSVVEQRCSVTRFTVQLISASVTADAKILAAAKTTTAQSVVDVINKYM